MARKLISKKTKGEPKPIEGTQTPGSQESPSTQAAPSSDPQMHLYQIGNQLCGAYHELSQKLYEASLESTKQQTKAAQSFTSTKQELGKETAKRASEA